MAIKALKIIYKSNCAYKKAGVIVHQITNESEVQEPEPSPSLAKKIFANVILPNFQNIGKHIYPNTVKAQRKISVQLVEN